MTQREDFSDGQVVELRSGGVPMTVQHFRADNMVCCFWFDGTELRHDAFKPEALVPYKHGPERASITFIAECQRKS